MRSILNILHKKFLLLMVLPTIIIVNTVGCGGEPLKISLVSSGSIAGSSNNTIATMAAAKQALQQVALIYHVPAGKPVRQDYKAAIESSIQEVKQWYAMQTPDGSTFSLVDAGQAEIVQSQLNETTLLTLQEGKPDRGVFNVFWNTYDDLRNIKGERPDNILWVVYTDVDIGIDPDTGNCNGAGTAIDGVTIMPSDDFKGLVVEQPLGCGGNDVNQKRWVGGMAFEIGLALRLIQPYDRVNGEPVYKPGLVGQCEAFNCLMSGGFRNFPATFLMEHNHQRLMRNPFFKNNLPVEHRLENANSRLCADLNLAKTADGTQAIHYTCSPSQPNFKWAFYPVEGNEAAHYIVNSKSQSCLTSVDSIDLDQVLMNNVVADVPVVPNQVVVRQCQPNEHFYWRKVELENGQIQLINQSSQLCLAVENDGRQNFNPLFVRECDSISADWKLLL